MLLRRSRQHRLLSACLTALLWLSAMTAGAPESRSLANRRIEQLASLPSVEALPSARAITAERAVEFHGPARWSSPVSHTPLRAAGITASAPRTATTLAHSPAASVARRTRRLAFRYDATAPPALL